MKRLIDLAALAKAGRFKTALDESAEIEGQSRDERLWLVQIPGKYGHVFVQGFAELGAYVQTYKNDRLERLLAIKGTRLLQRGDREASVAFRPKDLEAVAVVLGLRRRRQMSEEQKLKAGERLAAYRYSQQEAPSTSL